MVRMGTASPPLSSGENYTQEQYNQLIDKIQKYSHAYFTLDDSLIPDYQYDQLVLLAKSIEETHPNWISPYSPTIKLGGEIRSEFAKVEHSPPMLSLDNAFDWSDVVSFDIHVKKKLSDNQGVIYCCEPKLDGLAVELIYENGLLVLGSTRGDGIFGEDITHNIRTIRNIPLSLLIPHKPQRIVIRGECIFPITEFHKVNYELERNNEKIYANTRNLSAGTLRQKNSNLTAKRKIKFYPYAVALVQESEKSQKYNRCPTNQQDLCRHYFSLLGFEVISPSAVCRLEDIQDFYETLYAQRSNYDFDMDGMVIKVNDHRLYDILGYTSTSPRYAIAYKFVSQKAITVIENIEYSVGRTGVVTPVACLKAINLGGVMVQKASLHNIDEIRRLGIAVDDMVVVERAGDVIPKVVEVYKKNNTQKYTPFIVVCPACQSSLKKEDIYIRCINPECEAKQIASLQYIVSKSALNIEGLGKEWVAKLYKEGILKNVVDIYKLDKNILEDIEGMGPVLINKILQTIASRKSASFKNFIISLCIASVGTHVATLLAENFENIKILQNTSIEQLKSIHEIGDVMAENIYSFFHHEKNIQMINEWFDTGFTIQYKKQQASNNLMNKKFIFTGTLISLSRIEAQEKVQENGGTVVSAISKQIDFVVVGEGHGSKYAQALKLNLVTISEQEFIEML